MNDREIARLEKMKKLKQELIDMLDGDEPLYFQKEILKNIDDRILEMTNKAKVNPKH